MVETVHTSNKNTSAVVTQPLWAQRSSLQSACSQKSVHVVSATVQIHSDLMKLTETGMKSPPASFRCGFLV